MGSDELFDLVDILGRDDSTSVAKNLHGDEIIRNARGTQA
jgi:hypothetical protein